MTRVLLVIIAALVALLVLGHVHRASRPSALAAGPAPAAHHAALSDSARRLSGKAGDTAAAGPRGGHDTTAARLAADDGSSSGTPTIDLLARAEARGRLARAAEYTYFDSLFNETDSVVRRWPDPNGVPLAVAIASPEGPNPALESAVRGALANWEGVRSDLRFTLVGDTTGAQIVVHGRPKFDGDRAGQTDLQWTKQGPILSASVTISLGDSLGKPLSPSTLAAIATHEVGHALGLGHSPNPADVMFAKAQTDRLTQRDRATLTLLYELPLGYIRELNTK
jgi:hypothetical protein